MNSIQRDKIDQLAFKYKCKLTYLWVISFGGCVYFNFVILRFTQILRTRNQKEQAKQNKTHSIALKKLKML